MNNHQSPMRNLIRSSFFESPRGATCLREAVFSLRSHFGELGPAKAGEMAWLHFKHWTFGLSSLQFDFELRTFD